MNSMVLWYSLMQIAQASDCPAPATTIEVVVRLDAAEQAYADLDVEAFGRSLDEAALLLPCLSEPVTSTFAARLHRDMGLRLFVTREREMASRAFAASRFADENSTFSEDLIPAGHAIHALWETWDVSSGQFERVREPVSGRLLFDGVEGLERPKTWPALVQLLDAEDTVTISAYTFPEDPMPVYEGKPLPVAEAGGGRSLSPKVVLLTSAGVSAIASGVLYTMAAGSAATFDEYHSDWELADVKAQRRKTNTLVGVSVGAGLLAVGTGVGGAFVGDR